MSLKDQIDAVVRRIAKEIVASGAHAGDIKFSGRATAPAGWLIADGAVVSRATYPGLFAAIGTAFGAGNGSTTFGLPDLRSRVAVGVSPVDPNFNSVGKIFGSAMHILSIAEMPTHNAYDEAGGGWTRSGNTAGPVGAPVGEGQPHNNIQPSLALTPLIKT